MAKNYYAILGISPTATFDEIPSAYRQRAKQYHPDYFGKDSAQFLGVQEAYNVLGDPSNRISYDRTLGGAGIKIRSLGQSESIVTRPRRPAVEPLRSTRKPMDLGRVFPQTSFQRHRPSLEEIFENVWNFPDRPPLSKSEKFRTLTMEIRLTGDQANRGGRVQISIPLQRPCSTCNGSGDAGPFQCWNCSGTGSALNEFSFHVEYPPGIRDFYQVAIPLERYGIPDICPIMLFRVSEEGDFEDTF